MRKLLVLCGVLLITGCAAPMVELSDTENLHFIHGAISKEQVRESILEGARYARWEAEVEGSSTILATYRIRSHTVQVSIYYSDHSYRITYKSSVAMKMYCNARERDKGKYRVSGTRNCPSDRAPIAIRSVYKSWIDSLVAQIEFELSGRKQN